MAATVTALGGHHGAGADLRAEPERLRGREREERRGGDESWMRRIGLAPMRASGGSESAESEDRADRREGEDRAGHQEDRSAARGERRRGIGAERRRGDFASAGDDALPRPVDEEIDHPAGQITAERQPGRSTRTSANSTSTRRSATAATASYDAPNTQPGERKVTAHSDAATRLAGTYRLSGIDSIPATAGTNGRTAPMNRAITMPLLPCLRNMRSPRSISCG